MDQQTPETSVTDPAPEPQFNARNPRQKPKPLAPPGKIWKKGKLIPDPSIKKTPEYLKALKEARQAQSAKGREKLRELENRRTLAISKMKQGIPLTPQEAADAAWQRGGAPAKGGKKKSSYDKQQAHLQSLAEIVIKPANVQDLRLRVEQTATRLGYDPFESLIRMVQDPDSGLKPDERAGVHKTLMPFLVPQLPPVPKDMMETDKSKVKVVMHQLIMGTETEGDYHETKPKTVDFELMGPQE